MSKIIQEELDSFTPAKLKKQKLADFYSDIIVNSAKEIIGYMIELELKNTKKQEKEESEIIE